LRVSRVREGEAASLDPVLSVEVAGETTASDWVRSFKGS
jgi:hypothetical protein